MKFNQAYRKIVIQQHGSTSQSAYGTPTGTWTTYHTAAAEVRPARAGTGEGTQEAREVATTRLEFTIRYFAGITQAMRIVYDSKNWDIISLQEFGREHLKIVGQYRV